MRLNVNIGNKCKEAEEQCAEIGKLKKMDTVGRNRKIKEITEQKTCISMGSIKSRMNNHNRKSTTRMEGINKRALL